MKIYTKTGDTGTTSIYTGKRISKNTPLMEAIGTVDESNSAIGLALALVPQEDCFQEIITQLEIIQHGLFDVGAALATPRHSNNEKKLEKTRFDHEAIEFLEQWIDSMEARLPKLTHFILPGGHPAGATLHVARSCVRRAERQVVPLFEQGEVSHDTLIYLNRLSDYLFVVSRLVNQLLGVPETQWQPHKTA